MINQYFKLLNQKKFIYYIFKYINYSIYKFYVKVYKFVQIILDFYKLNLRQFNILSYQKFIYLFKKL